MRQLRKRLETVLRPSLCDVSLHLPRVPGRRLLRERSSELVDVHPPVPELEGAHGRELSHRLAVGAHRCRTDARPHPAPETELACGDCEARHEALEIPLERARERLVEVVDAEYEPAIGSGEDAEVREVGITAELRM